jgi:hypothetical protein
MKWIKDAARRRCEAKERRERMWMCWILGGQAGVSAPKGRHYEDWGRIQAEILARIQQHWPETHTYVRLHTCYTYVLDDIGQLPERTRFERVPTKDKDDYLFLFPDCEDRDVWQVVLGIETPFDYGKMILMFDHRVEDCWTVVSNAYEVVRQQSDPRAQPWTVLVKMLPECQALCYSVDENLWIGKVDLPEGVVPAILESIAREEDLELVVEKG